MPKLYILCGIPGSGKSTWAERCDEVGVVYVSRDSIRFSMLQEGDQYFAHETEVYKEFIYEIAQSLIHGYDVVADATHINSDSRHKLTQAIDEFYTDYEIIYVAFPLTLNECLVRNEFREGIKRVPTIAMHTMYNRFHMPELSEDKRAIMVIDGSKENGRNLANE